MTEISSLSFLHHYLATVIDILTVDLILKSLIMFVCILGWMKEEMLIWCFCVVCSNIFVYINTTVYIQMCVFYVLFETYVVCICGLLWDGFYGDGVVL